MRHITRNQFLLPLAACALLSLAGCSKAPEPAKEAAKERETAPPPKPVEPPPPVEAPKPAEETAKKKTGGVPDLYKVRFATSKGNFTVEVHRAWAPRGAEQFYRLIQDKFYNEARFFRIVPNFVVQFGLAADPAKTKKWSTPIKDDPVTQTNKLGSMVFATAGPNTRTTQVFINLRSNQFLDSQGFAPFGEITEGMEVIQNLYKGYGERPDQGEITTRGNAYLKAEFPNLDYIKTATIVQ